MANLDTSPRTPAPALIGLLAILAVTAWWRGHTIGPTLDARLGVAPYPVVRGESEPLDCDEAAYAYMARRLIEGDRLYADLSENKPPLGYWIYEGAVALGGPDELAIRLLPIPFVLASVAIVWWLGLRLGGPGAAVLSGLLCALLSTDPYLYGNGAQLEQAINCFSVAALAATVAAAGSSRRRGAWLVSAGVALGLAILVKQVAALHVPVFVVAVLALPRQGEPGEAGVRSLLRSLGAFFLGLVAPILVAGAVLAAQGVTAEAFDDIVRHGRALAADVSPEPNAPSPAIRWLTGNADPSGNLPPPFGTSDYLVWWGLGSWPIWLAGLPSLIWLAIGRGGFGRRAAAAWTASAVLQVLAPGLYWAHYYLLPVPGLALSVAVAVSDAFAARPRRWWSTAIGLGLLSAILAFGAIQIRDYLLVPAEELTIRYKGGRQWVELRKLGRLLGEQTAGWDDPRLHIWGWQSPLLFYSGLDAASRHFFTNNLMRDYADRPHPVVSPRIDELMADLRDTRPELVFVAYPPFPALREFLSSGYLPSSLVPVSPDGRGLWIREDRWADLQLDADRLRRSAPASPGRRPRRSRRSGPGGLP
ncbi:ArnT family glycosyltransferase [Tautonia sociabilis]|uniref:Phospholipid carrier-dependent glycosyltransferase n=1 Tax=Tautonia sociabilis TaxID=2080755 RepID=A0A432MMN4_9BACT|nr:glycosyltransferase family 39 protein [Tautonia sociabilis]RUL88457.1 phospholipid carrier-dependent glycosyltransferase [Tautonia sociabilis]